MSENGNQFGPLARGEGDPAREDGSGRRDEPAAPSAGGSWSTDRSLSADTSRPIELSPVPFDVSPQDDDADEVRRPPSGSRTRRIMLGALLAAGLAGTAVLGTTAWRITSQRDATLTVPATVAGLRLNNTDDAAATADYLRTALTAEVSLDDAVGAVYGDPADEGRSVLFFGGTGLIWTPGRDLETAFDLAKDDAGAVDDLSDVPAGKLGGAMKCGTTDDAGGSFAVCGWADHGSLALALFPNRSATEAAPLLRSIREAMQTRE